MTAKRPSKAFILAAGFGTRMLPLTRIVPKALLPLWGKPMLQHTLELLKSWGVREVVINMHHLPNEILQFVLRHEQMGLRIHLSYEPEILGTGGALRKAEWFLGDDPFWLINSDIAADLKPAPLLSAFTPNTLAVLWLHPTKGPRTVETAHGLVTSFRGGGASTFCGLHLLSPRILDYLPAEPVFAGIIEAYERAMEQGERVAGVCVKNSYWADIGRPEQLLQAHAEVRECFRRRKPGARLYEPSQATRARELRREGVRTSGFVCAGLDVSAEAGARVEDSIIMDGSTLASSADLRNVIVAPGTRVTGRAEHMLVPAGCMLDAAEQDALTGLGWRRPGTTAECLPARGSARTFTRLRQGRRTLMLIRYSLERPENGFYARHAVFLASLGIPVPEVLHHDASLRFMLMQDLGHASIAAAMRVASPPEAERMYRRVLDHVLALHEKGLPAARRRRIPMAGPFSPGLYRWEREYFISEYVVRHLRASPRTAEGVRLDLRRVARRLSAVPQVLIHRDLQSSNIILHRKEPFFIDFQGMRAGPAVYDLASLLCDPYVMLSPSLQGDLLARCARRWPAAAMVEELFWWAAIERLAQALGAYARLGRMPGAERFLIHIGNARIMLRRALESIDDLPYLAGLFWKRD